MSDLAFHIHTFVPDAEGEELEHRTALLKARDYATALVPKTHSERAYTLACEARDMASDFVFADARPAQLALSVKCCRYMVMAAMLADHLEFRGVGL